MGVALLPSQIGGVNMAEKDLPTGITLRKDGRYMWRFKYNGLTYSGYTKKLKDAEKQMRDKRYEVEHGLYSKEKNIILDAWFKEWIDTYKAADCKESTLDFYRNTYDRYIKPVFGRRKIKTLKAEQIQRFTNEKAKNYSKSIASTINFLLYDCLRQAARVGFISKNPMDNTTPPKFKPREERKALTKAQEKAFLEAVKDSSYYPLYRTAALSGMRIGEILGLSWSDVDFKNEGIYIRHTLCYTTDKGQYLDTPKTKASRRTIPMHKGEELYQLLQHRKIEQKKQKVRAGSLWVPNEGMEDLVFTTETGAALYATNVRTQQRAAIRKMQEGGADIPAFTFHMLRHCFATRCIEAGMDPKTLQAILGHSTFAMTMDLYCDVMEETKREAMKKVQAAL